MRNEVEYEVTPAGNLVVTWLPEYRRDELLAMFWGANVTELTPELENVAIDMMIAKAKYWDFMDLMEPLVTNDEYDWVNAEDVGALTSGPLLGKGVERDDEGNVVSVEAVFYYNMYAIRSPMDDLITHGQVVWLRAPRDEA